VAKERQCSDLRNQATGAKVMTFTASKCVHNLPQTSIQLGKLIATK